jgi:hypothetical protein
MRNTLLVAKLWLCNPDLKLQLPEWNREAGASEVA